MKGKQRPLGFMGVLALGLALVLGAGFTPPALASSEDVAMFYDDLGQYGPWVDYENYGPVWHPSKVRRIGGLIPTAAGSPPNKATYSSPRNPGVGPPTITVTGCPPPGTAGSGSRDAPGTPPRWTGAPAPKTRRRTPLTWAGPPFRRPTMCPPAYAPPGYGAPGADLLTSPLWIFARAASFLLGFGQPYTPAYSYGGCGCLAPPSFVPTFFRQTELSPTIIRRVITRSLFRRGFRWRL